MPKSKEEMCDDTMGSGKGFMVIDILDMLAEGFGVLSVLCVLADIVLIICGIIKKKKEREELQVTSKQRK